MTAALPQLRELHLTDNGWQPAVPAGLSPLLGTLGPQLQRLHLDHLARVPSYLSTVLQQCTHLTELRIHSHSRGPSTAELSKALAPLGRLRSLDVNFRVSCLAAIAVAATGLTRLRLNDDALVMPNSLTTLASLAELSLPSSELAVQGLHLLRQLTRLEAFVLVESGRAAASPDLDERAAPAARPGQPWSLPPRLQELHLDTYLPGRLMGPCQVPETLRGIELHSAYRVAVVLVPDDDTGQDRRLLPGAHSGLLNCMALLRGGLQGASLSIGTLQEYDETPVPSMEQEHGNVLVAGLESEEPAEEGDEGSPDVGTGPSHSIWLAALAPLQLPPVRPLWLRRAGSHSPRA